MTVIEAMALGFVQGVGEFLPISSSGHLVLLQRAFGISEGAMAFDVAVHLGTLVALIVVMRKRLLMYIRNPLGRVPVLVVVGTIPTAAIALALKKTISGLFESGASLGVGFLLTAAMLWFAEAWSKRMASAGAKGAGRRIDEATAADAIMIGIAQGVATVPAVSRSGSAISSGLVCGLDREAAVEYAFWLSIPITLLAVADDVLGIAMGGGGGGDVGAAPMVVGTLVAMAVGIPAARLMLRRIRRISLKWFAAYVGALGALALIDQLFIGAVLDKII